MKIKSMQLESFKGVKKAEYTFGDLTKLIGTNGTGKTTIQTAFYWLFASKDSELRNHPDIIPNDMEECNPTVRIVLDVNGKEVSVCKMQKVKKNKKGEITTTPNSYTVNEVPKTERDFKSYLEGLGVDSDRLLMFSHPNLFMQGKTAEMRELLFKMTTSRSDLEIAKSMEETASVANQLENYTIEEIEAMNKATKKKADEQIKAIPNQIIGKETSKVDLDLEELFKQQELLRAELHGVEESIAYRSCEKQVKTLEQELFNLQFDINGIEQVENDKLTRAKREMNSKVYDKQDEIEKIETSIVGFDSQIEVSNSKIKDLEEDKKYLIEQWKMKKVAEFDETPYLFNDSAWLFDDSSTICISCGQILPEDKISALKADFEQRKEQAKEASEKTLNDARERFEISRKSDMDRIADKGNSHNAEIEKLQEHINACFDNKKAAENNLAGLKAELISLQSEQSKLSDSVDLSSNKEYQELLSKKSKLETKVKDLKDGDNKDLINGLKIKQDSLLSNLNEITETIGKVKHNDEIDDEIAKLNESKFSYELAKAKAEGMLYQLELISKKKNELLVDEINKNFSVVKWKLFDYQKNGGYKDVCIPMVDGYEFGVSTNTGREIQAKIDICDSLQKYFKMEVPIFLDHASIIDEKLLPKTSCQLILLVNDSSVKTLKVEV